MTNKKLLWWLLGAYVVGMFISHLQMKQIIKEVRKKKGG